MLNEFHLKDIPTVLKFLFGTVNSASDSEQVYIYLESEVFRFLNYSRYFTAFYGN